MGQRPLSWARTRPDPPSLFHLLLALSEFTVGGHGGQVLRCWVYGLFPWQLATGRVRYGQGSGPRGPWWLVGLLPIGGCPLSPLPWCVLGRPVSCTLWKVGGQGRSPPLSPPLLLAPGRLRRHSPVLFFSEGPPPAPSRVTWCAPGTLELPLPGGLCLLVGWWPGPWGSGPPSLLPVCVPCLPACRSLNCSSVKWTRAPALAGCRGRQSVVSP